MYLKLYYIIQHFSTFVLQKNVFLRIRKYLNWNKNIGLEHFSPTCMLKDQIVKTGVINIIFHNKYIISIHVFIYTVN